MLTDGGHVVTGMVGSAEKAIPMLEERQCDVAVVDANLAGSCAAPIGAALRKRGIPFVVISGYSKQQLLGRLARRTFFTQARGPQ